jgi:hypothetical protein
MQYPIIAQPQYAFAPTMMAEGGLIPAAKAVQSKGRNGDSMLVHMTPGEVGGLQALAMQHGGSLSINPQTGLPEAGFLKNLFPALLGAGLMMIPGLQGVGAGYIGAGVGALETVRTGDLGRGILAGLGAYGGANLAGGAMAAGASGAAPGATMVSPGGDVTLASSFTGPGAQAATQAATPSTFMGNLSQAGQGVQNIFTGQEGAFGRFIGDPAVAANAKTGAAATPATGLGGAMGAAKTAGAMLSPSILATPQYAPPEQEKEESDYEGPYTPTKREVRYPTDEERRRRTAEFTYFTPSNPVPFAEGGDVGSAPSITPAEAQVYSQIANVQRLAGLPAIDTSGFNISPSIDRAALVYNPIGYSPTEGGMTERNYGFERLGDAAQSQAGVGGLQFFQPVGGYKGGYGFVTSAQSFADKLTGKEKDPEEYAAGYETFTPTDRVNMADYQYDPLLGGYVKRPKPLINSSDGYGFYSYNYSKGGSVPQLENGGFVLTKKAVDGLGKGDNKRGQRVASRGLGAIPIKGPGTGTSDSIPTSIDGKRPARVSNGEAYVPKKQVAKHGGAKKFYALMKKAERRA